MAVFVGAPSYLLGVVSSEWGAIATGTSVGVIGAGFAVVSFIRDKQIASLRKTIDGLAEEVESRRAKWMAAEQRSDEIEAQLEKMRRDLDRARQATCPVCDQRMIPESDSDVQRPTK